MFESVQENEQPQHEQKQMTAVFSIVLGNVDNLSSVYMSSMF